MLPKKCIYDLDLGNLCAIFEQWNEPSFRSLQMWKGLYQNLWEEPNQFSTLPKEIRQKIENQFLFSTLTPLRSIHSKDNKTHKTLFRLHDGREIEAVLMLYDQRRTLCISTQAGCAMGCVFCATGQMGFYRNLTSGEIVEQVLYFSRRLKAHGERVTHVVFMGMGEPFHNYEMTMTTINQLNHHEGFNLGARKLTISTVGVVPMIYRFAEEGDQVNLAISLHAAEDNLRTSLLPINRKYPLCELFEACHYYVRKTKRRITFEWVLIHKINDGDGDALDFVKRAKGLLCHVNIIPLNPTHRYHKDATDVKHAQEFKRALENNGIPCTIRLRRGIDIEAGCGQLAANTNTQ